MPQVSINLIHELKAKAHAPKEKVPFYGLRTGFLRAWVFTVVKVFLIASILHSTGFWTNFEDNIALLDKYIRNDFPIEQPNIRTAFSPKLAQGVFQPRGPQAVSESGSVAGDTTDTALSDTTLSSSLATVPSITVINNGGTPTSLLTESRVDEIVRFNIASAINARYLLAGTGDDSAGCLQIDSSGVVSTRGVQCRTGGGGSSSGGGSATMTIGSTITGATAGSVLFAGIGGTLAQDNANFFFDDTTNSLNLGGNLTVAGLGGGGTQCLQTNNTGLISATGSGCGGGSSAWSALTAPTGNLTLAHGANTTAFTFNGVTTTPAFALSSTSITSGTLLDLSINGTTGLTDQKALNVSLTGNNATGSQRTYAASFTNAHIGATATNIAGYFSATGSSTANYAGIFDKGQVGIGIISPTNFFQASPIIYNIGTASQSGTTVTGVGANWSPTMIGDIFVFANGTRRTVTAFIDTSHLTVSPSGTVSSQAYTINQPGLSVDADGDVEIGSLTNPASNSRLFVYGGSSGANIDARGDANISDQATIELEGSDYDSQAKSVRLQYFGPNGVGTTMGFGSQNLGVLMFSGDTSIIATTTSPLIFGTSNAEKMRLDANGNLGIGTINPGDKLTVVSSGAKTSANTAASITDTSTSSTGAIDKIALHVSSTGAWNGTGSNNYGLKIDPVTGANKTDGFNYNLWSGPSSSSLFFGDAFLSGAANAFTEINNDDTQPYGVSIYLENNASTGIGLTSTTVGFADASSNTGVQANALGENSIGTSINLFGVNSTASQLGDGNTSFLVGVQGTADQDGAGTANIMAGFYSPTNNRDAGTVNLNAGLYIEDQSGVANVANNNYQIYSANANPFVVRADGNVGIGTTTPTQKLTVTDGVSLNSLSSSFSLTNVGGINASGSNFTNTVGVNGKYLYVSNSTIAGTCSGTTLTGCEFSIYDITNPASPVAVSGIDVGSNTTFAVQGRYVYLVTDTNGGNEIRVYDVSNPSSPTLVGGYDNGVGAAMNYQQAVISGKYLYVGGTNSTDTCSGTTLTGCELSIFDISNPAVPTPVGGYNATAWSADLTISGKYIYQVYVTGNGNEFRIIDVSNPSSPSLTGSVTLGVDGSGVKVSGKYAYIATGNVAGTCSGTTLTGCEFRIYDISNPASPVAVNGMDNGGIYSGKVILMGNYALVANFFATSGNEIRAYNISNPSAITAAGGLDLGVGTAGFWTLATQGRYVIAAGDGMSGNDIRIYSMAGVDSPAINTGTLQANTLRATEDLQVGGTITATGGINVGVGGILSGGPVAIQSSTTSSSLFALDIKNSAATSLLVVRDDGNIGIGTASPSTKLEIGSSDLGNGTAGPVITLGRNTNGTNTGAGSINFQSKAGTAGFVWQDNAGNLRINTAAPSNANDTAGVVVGTQTSTRNTKQDIHDYTDYASALQMVADMPLHTFRYIKDVQGYGTNSPLAKAHIGYIADEVPADFMWGNSIDQVSVNGILLASVKELNEQVQALTHNQALAVVPPTLGDAPLVLHDHLYLSSDTIGEAKILQGDASVRVSFEKPYEYQPIVTTTPEDRVGSEYWISDKDASGFTINISDATDKDITFDWHAFAGEGTKISVSNGTLEDVVLVVNNGQQEPENQVAGDTTPLTDVPPTDQETPSADTPSADQSVSEVPPTETPPVDEPAPPSDNSEPQP